MARVPFRLALIACALLACRDQSNAPERPTCPGALRAAMLLPGAKDDRAWSQAGYEGLKLIEQELGAQVTASENVDGEHAAAVMRDHASHGYDFVVGFGGEYVKAAETVANEFPRTRFAVVESYPGNNKNLGGLSFRDEEIGYLCGVAAALATHAKKVAFVGGVAYPNMVASAGGFERGARSVAPTIDVSVEWIGSWSDEQGARAIARKLLARGVDVLLASADQSGVGVFEEAKNAGARAIGWSVDQYSLAPGVIVTSCMQRPSVLLLEGARLVQEGRWEGKKYRFGLREGAQELAPYHGMLPPEAVARLDAVAADIRAGRIDVLP